MKPAFDSWQAFIAMNGYAFYVWTAAAVTVIALFALWWISLLQQRRALRDLQAASPAKTENGS